jgi:RNA polymerase sigma-70 factor (ECF subfamily)
MEKPDIDSLVGKYGKKVYNLSYRLMGNRQDAEDITQDTFLQVYRGLDRFRGDSAVYTWIYRIAVNNCLQAKRRLNRAYIDSLDEKIEQFANDIPDVVRDWEQDPEKRYLYDELLHTIQQECFHFMSFRLTDEQRVVYLLWVVMDFSLDDISAILQIEKATVKARLQRAKANLKSYFGSRCQWILKGEHTCSCRSRIGFALAVAPEIMQRLRNYEMHDNTRNLVHNTLKSIDHIDKTYRTLPIEDYQSDMLLSYLKGA